jgi:glutamine amidotransferase
MCRLVAYQGASLSLHTCVFGGGHSLYRQSWAPRELLSGSVNVDGFGLTWAPEEGASLVRLARVEPIWHDPEIPTLLRSIQSRSVLAALRNATPGLPVGPESVLPLRYGDRALALNGYVPDFRARHMRSLRAPLRDEWYARLLGVGDAETLFLRVLQAIEDGAAPGEALLLAARAVGDRLEEGEVAPLTLVLQGPEGITALHLCWNGRANSLYLAREISLAPGGTVLASEPLTTGHWEPVPADSLVLLRDGGAEVVAL